MHARQSSARLITNNLLSLSHDELDEVGDFTHKLKARKTSEPEKIRDKAPNADLWRLVTQKKKPMRLISFFIVVGIVLSSCSDERSKLRVGRESDAMMYAPASEQIAGQKSISPAGEERKLIREANIHFRCADVKDTKAQIAQLVKDFKGYITNEGQNTYDNQLNYHQTIHVPASELDNFVAQLEPLAEEVESKNISSQDVTEEYIDVEARLKTKKELEARYRDILKQARTVEDLLSVERELGNVRSEIESMEGRMQYLNNRISYSVVNVSYYQSISADFGFGFKISNALGAGWDNFLSFLIALIDVWPFLVLAAAGTFLILRYRRRKKDAK